MQESQVGLPVPGFEFESQDFIVTYFDVYDDLISTEVKKLRKKQLT